MLRPFEPAVYFTSLLLFRPDVRKAILVKKFTVELLSARHRPLLRVELGAD